MDATSWAAVAALAAAATAGATLWVAIVARSSAGAARRAAVAAERSLLLQSVPVVFGLKAQPTGGGRTEVVLKAVGRGVALNVAAEVFQEGNSFGSTSAISHLEGGQEHRPLDTNLADALVDPRRPHKVVTSYHDAAGNAYRTVRLSQPGGIGKLKTFERRSRKSSDWESLLE